MNKNYIKTLAIALLFALTFLGCDDLFNESSGSQESGGEHEGLEVTKPQAIATVGDVAQTFRGKISLLALPRQDDAAHVSLQLTALIDDEPRTLSFSWKIHDDTFERLNRGEILNLSNDDVFVTYPRKDVLVIRPIESLALLESESGRMSFSAVLGADVQATQGEDEQISLTFAGIVIASCRIPMGDISASDGNAGYILGADPMWESEFCRNIKETYGLEEIIIF